MMFTDRQIEKAKTFATLHELPEILVLPNAWNAGSARIFTSVGFHAIGTTSAGIAFSLGLRDGERISLEDSLFVIRKICERVDVPVTADIESGYSDLDTTVSRVIEAGAVGINVEDSGGLERELLSISKASENIRRIRAIADGVGFPLFINARIDGIMLKKENLEQTVERASAYVSAGANSVFIPRIIERSDIEHLVRKINAPLNILATPASPTVRELEALGVSRVSMGGSLTRTALAIVYKAAIDLRENGSFRFSEGALTKTDIYRLFG